MTLGDVEAEKIRNLVGLKQGELAVGPLSPGIVPIKIQCRWSSCRHGRHTLDHFHPGSRGSGGFPPGHCQRCGERVADLPLPGEVMPLDDEQYFNAFANFPKELIRAHYWNVRIDLLAHNQAVRLGRSALHRRAREAVLTALLTDDAYSGRRAPYNGQVVAYAQHATGTCCRSCAAYLHGLPRDMKERPSDEQLEYAVSLAQAYLDLRFPDLADGGTHVPGVPSIAGPSDDEVIHMERELVDAFARDLDPVGLVVPVRSTLKMAPRDDTAGGAIIPLRTAPTDKTGAA